MRIKFNAKLTGLFPKEGNEKLPYHLRQQEYLENVDCEVVIEVTNDSEIQLIDWNKK